MQKLADFVALGSSQLLVSVHTHRLTYPHIQLSIPWADKVE